MAPVPETLLRALHIPRTSEASLSTSGLGSGFTTTGVLRVLGEMPNEERQYFLKTSTDDSAAEMFQGEYESLNAIANTVPGFCPRALAWGAFSEAEGGGFFLATEFLDLRDRSRANHSTLAEKLGRLHTTPAPPDPETGRSRYGFPVPTYCGDTRQPNQFWDSWADFYANERLLAVMKTAEERNGPDHGLRELVERTVYKVIPALLGDGHLGYNSNGHGQGIKPVVIHGDLWCGNAARGVIVGSGWEPGDVVYDPSACYGHSEFELGIMRMFGGFKSSFFPSYHFNVPMTEPVAEYEDRVSLYALYHHLNHYAIFGAGYRSGAASIMQKLLKKYEEYPN